MKQHITRKSVLAAAGALVLFGAGVLAGANKFSKPATILHVVTIKWKADATAEQKKAVLDGVEKMAADVPGLKNIWVKGIKVQGEGYTDAIVMEFDSQKSFDAYKDHPAHKAWEKIYLPVRGQSTTHDITN